MVEFNIPGALPVRVDPRVGAGYARELVEVAKEKQHGHLARVLPDADDAVKLLLRKLWGFINDDEVIVIDERKRVLFALMQRERTMASINVDVDLFPLELSAEARLHLPRWKSEKNRPTFLACVMHKHIGAPSIPAAWLAGNHERLCLCPARFSELVELVIIVIPRVDV